MTSCRPSLLQVSLLFGVVLVQGCANIGTPSSGSMSTSLSENSSATRLGQATTNQVVLLPTTNDLGVLEVRVGEAYTAASGRECRRLTSSDNELIGRLVCYQADHDRWALTRSMKILLDEKQNTEVLQSTSAKGPGDTDQESVLILASDSGGPQVSISQHGATSKPAIKKHSFLVENNQTLWSFARKYTGNGVNWKAIAKFNEISDGGQIDAGAVLSVPEALVKFDDQ